MPSCSAPSRSRSRRAAGAVAVRLAGGAAVAAEEHHAVAEIARLLRREDGAQLLFHAQRVLTAVGETETARDADAVRVADVCGLVIDVAENEVRGLAPDAGETRQLLHRAGDPAAVLFKENFRALDEVFGLGIVKAAGLDGFADLFIAGVGERLERRELCVQRGGDHVHTRVGALGGEPHGEKAVHNLFGIAASTWRRGRASSAPRRCGGQRLWISWGDLPNHSCQKHTTHFSKNRQKKCGQTRKKYAMIKAPGKWRCSHALTLQAALFFMVRQL